jgi:hypothetical protein
VGGVEQWGDEKDGVGPALLITSGGQFPARPLELPKRIFVLSEEKIPFRSPPALAGG